MQRTYFRSIHLAMMACVSFVIAIVFAAPQLLSANGKPGAYGTLEKVPVLILQAEATMDGVPRPALGRSFTDTMTAGFLKTNYFTVIDYMSSEAIATELSHSRNPLPPEAVAGRYGQISGAKLVYVPRLIVEENHYVMTVKKIRVSDGEVIDVYEASDAGGDRGLMFALCGKVMKQINAEVARTKARWVASHRPPRTGPAIIEYTRANTDSKEDEGEITRKPTTMVASNDLGADAASDIRKAGAFPNPQAINWDDHTEFVGTVNGVNRDWRFCVVQMKGEKKLAIDDVVIAKIANPLQSIVRMQVVKVEGGQAVADFTSDVDASTLRSGTRVYRIPR